MVVGLLGVSLMQLTAMRGNSAAWSMNLGSNHAQEWMEWLIAQSSRPNQGTRLYDDHVMKENFVALSSLDADPGDADSTQFQWSSGEEDLLEELMDNHFVNQDGEPFDPLFYRDGETPAAGIYRVEDDYFLECTVRDPGAPVRFGWHGRRYRCDPPPDLTLPAFLEVDGVADPPPGRLVLALRRPPGLLDLLRSRPVPYQAGITAVRDPG